jgi:hypothetical protein
MDGYTTVLATMAAVVTVGALVQMYLWWEGKIFDFPWLLRAYIVYAVVVPGVWFMTDMMAPDLGFDAATAAPYFIYGSIAVLAGGVLADIYNWLTGANRVPPPFG